MQERYGGAGTMSNIRAYFGNGRGKTAAALGYAVTQAARGASVIIIGFLKQRDDEVFDYLTRLEPEIRCFRFQKSKELFEELPPECRNDEVMNMKNGLNYAKKVLQIGECDILILDEVLGLVDHGIITADELLELAGSGEEHMQVIVTGQKLDEALKFRIPCVYELKTCRQDGQDVE